MASTTAMIGLATLDSEPRVDATRVSFFCDCRKIMKSSSGPIFSQGILTGLEGLPTSEMHGLCLESFLRQHLLHREGRRAVGYLLLLL